MSQTTHGMANETTRSRHMEIMMEIKPAGTKTVSVLDLVPRSR